MQSHPIKFKCGHERAMPLEETGKDLEAKIAILEMFDCPSCVLMRAKLEAVSKARTR